MSAIASDIEEITIEAVIESRLVELLEDAIAERPDGLIIRARHEVEIGATPSIVASAVRLGDADIPGWWRVEVSAKLSFIDGEISPATADTLFRAVDEVMGESAPTLKTALITPALAVAGVEYDDPFEVERDDDGETRTYTCLVIAGLIDPNP